jgi:glutamate racemase
LWAELPDLPYVYLADQAHVPYGSRTLAEVRAFSEGIARYLISQGATLIVVACNAASAASLHHLRQCFPAMSFIGMEPAVKPAAERTQSGVVGVLATPATFQGALYASVVERFAQGVQLLTHTCPGLVAQIEAGQTDAPETIRILENAIRPMLSAGIDTIVLGCTHYPFVISQIETIAGPGVRVIDPAPAVARQTRRFIPPGMIAQTRTSTRFITTGNPIDFQRTLEVLLDVHSPVECVAWAGDHHLA